MRSHSDIVKAAGPADLADKLALPIHTVRSWMQRDSIPPEKWAWFAEQGHATLAELATARAA